MTNRYSARAEAAFISSLRDVDADIDTMLGDHSMKGRLQSGATIKEALRIFEDHTSRALARTLAEAAKLIEHRGRKWRAAMDGVAQALDEHLGRAPDFLDKTIKLADRGGSPSVAAAVELIFEEMRSRLEGQLSEFRDGWTAPVPKPWKDRHPVLYAVLLLLIGALVGLATPVARDLIQSSVNVEKSKG